MPSQEAVVAVGPKRQFRVDGDETAGWQRAKPIQVGAPPSVLTEHRVDLGNGPRLVTPQTNLVRNCHLPQVNKVQQIGERIQQGAIRIDEGNSVANLIFHLIERPWHSPLYRAQREVIEAKFIIIADCQELLA
jgi:hypothetical protein